MATKNQLMKQYLVSSERKLEEMRVVKPYTPAKNRRILSIRREMPNFLINAKRG